MSRNRSASDAVVVKQSERVDRVSSQVITKAHIEAYAENGVICLRGVISPDWLDLIELAIKRIRNMPGPYATHYFAGQPGEFYDDHVNYAANPELQILLKNSPIADMMKEIFQTKNLWLFYDQIFIKEGGYSARTPWHQDTPYWLTEGRQTGSMWISLDPLKKEEALEFVPGSHRGPIYNAMVFEGDGPGTPWYDTEDMPLLPDIEKEREKWNIISSLLKMKISDAFWQIYICF
jgi:ectoine hydroxylase-related dioxygenase (phytanoyl-CoA dioxygenase family)